MLSHYAFPSFLPTSPLITTLESSFLSTVVVATPDCLWRKDLWFQMCGNGVSWSHKDLSKIRALCVHLRNRRAAYSQTSEPAVAQEVHVFDSRHQCASGLMRLLSRLFHGPVLKSIINTIVKSWHLGDNFSILKKDHPLN